MRRSGPDGKPILLVFVLVAVAGFVIYEFVSVSDAVIYVDNGGADPVAVEVDGKQKLVVPPGQVDSFACKAGSVRIVASRDGQVVFDETKTIEPRGKTKSKYLLNPEATLRYRNATVIYTEAGKDPYSQKPNFQNQEEVLRTIAEEMGFLPPTDWIDVSPDEVLEAPPESMEGNYSATRKVLTRVSKEDSDFVLKTLAAWKEKPLFQLGMLAMEPRLKEQAQMEEVLRRIDATPVGR
jgi:hypothetical protein